MIAENSKTALKLWKNSNLEIVKVGAISLKQKDTVLSKRIGRTKACVIFNNGVFLNSRYNHCFTKVGTLQNMHFTDVSWIFF